MSGTPSIAWLPNGYRVISTDAGVVVECERGCGWRLSLETVLQLPDHARTQLFRGHTAWHLRT
jgi:hypothetical protein